MPLICSLALLAMRQAASPDAARGGSLEGVPCLLSSADFGAAPIFSPGSRLFANASESRSGRKLPVGISPLQLGFAANEVFKRMIASDMDHRAGRSEEEIARMIERGTDEVIKRLEIPTNQSLLRK